MNGKTSVRDASVRALLNALIFAVSVAGCSDSSGPGSKHPFDSVFPGTWSGTYPLGQLTLRVTPGGPTTLAFFEGEATFMGNETGHTATYRFAALDHAESFSFLLYPHGEFDFLAAGKGGVTSKDTLLLQWDEPQSPLHRSVMGKADNVVLTR